MCPCLTVFERSIISWDQIILYKNDKVPGKRGGVELVSGSGVPEKAETKRPDVRDGLAGPLTAAISNGTLRP